MSALSLVSIRNIFKCLQVIRIKQYHCSSEPSSLVILLYKNVVNMRQTESLAFKWHSCMFLEAEVGPVS